MIRVTFDCPDAEIAGFLSVLFVIYTQEDWEDSAGCIMRELGPALGYLRDKLGDTIDEDGTFDSDLGYQFKGNDWEVVRSFIGPAQLTIDEKGTSD